MKTGIIVDCNNGGSIGARGTITPGMLPNFGISDALTKFSSYVRDDTFFLNQKIKRERVNNLRVVKYAMDYPPVRTELLDSYSEGDGMVPGGNNQFNLSVDVEEIFNVGDTILVSGVSGYEIDGVTPSSAELVLYVTKASASDGFWVMPVNGKKVNGTPNCLPDIDEGTSLIKLGSVMGTDMSTIFDSSRDFIPASISYCDCQKFFASTAISEDAIRRLGSNYKFNDSVEACKTDFLNSIERSYMFGKQGSLHDPIKDEAISFTGGIWKQAGKQWNYTTQSFTIPQIIEMLRQASNGYSTSDFPELFILCGSKLINYFTASLTGATSDLIKIEYTKKNSSFSIVCPFGKFTLVYYSLFDYVGCSENGFVTSLDNITEYIYSDLTTKIQTIEGSKTAVLTKCSCLTVNLPKRAMRIVKR